MNRLSYALLLACAGWLGILPGNAAELGGIAALAAGARHTCAITSSGALKCWGINNWGQLGYGPTNYQSSAVGTLGLGGRIAAVTGGFDHTCALTASSGVKCWGGNQGGQLGDGSTTTRVKPVDVVGLTGTIVAVAAGDYYTCALTSVGGVKCWGSPYGYGGGNSNLPSPPVDVAGLTSGVVAIAAGSNFTCALTAVGAVKCWGINDRGQLGDGTQLLRRTPVDVLGLSGGVAAIGAGRAHACAVTSAGGMKCWGANQFGELGDGTVSLQHLTPVDVAGLDGRVRSIAVGGGQTCALLWTGVVKCWGSNVSGELGVGAYDSQAAPVEVPGVSGGTTALAAGWRHTCALLADGRVRCWGDNSGGQVGGDLTGDRQPTPYQVIERDRTVVAFYNVALDNYFVTADPIEISAVDNGSAGLGWIRTGESFKSGGDTDVCRFYGSLAPGPNSHFFAVDGDECQGLIDRQFGSNDPRRLTVKNWNFESFDFSSMRPANGECRAGTVPVYRAYNNGFARGIDSNHRISSNPAAIQEVVARGWINEGVVMCAPT